MVRWRRATCAIAALAALSAGAVLILADDAPSSLDRAAALAADEDGFDGGLRAGETVARVAQHLERAVAECREDRRGMSCQALASALGWSQVLAAWVLECTDPGRHEARTRLTAYLEEVALVPPEAARAPAPPELPVCR